MTTDGDPEVLKAMRAARVQARGYADFFGWPQSRDVEEYGVVSALAESRQASGALFFTRLLARGRGNDPPDCEAEDEVGNRIAIEVTELVDAKAINAYKQGALI